MAITAMVAVIVTHLGTLRMIAGSLLRSITEAPHLPSVTSIVL